MEPEEGLEHPRTVRVDPMYDPGPLEEQGWVFIEEDEEGYSVYERLNRP